jgi:HEAT repeat protein
VDGAELSEAIAAATDRGRLLGLVSEVGVRRTSEALPAVIDAFERSDDPLVRERAVYAMTRIGGPGVRRALLAALHDDRPRTRKLALTALASDADREVQEHVASLLARESSADVRARAIAILADDRSEFASRVLASELDRRPRKNWLGIASELASRTDAVARDALSRLARDPSMRRRMHARVLLAAQAAHPDAGAPEPPDQR